MNKELKVKLPIHLIKIGNSRGFIIPQVILDALVDKNVVFEIQAFHDKLVITPTSNNREGWEAAFKVANDENYVAEDKAICLHEWDEGSHNVHKCKICGTYNC